MHERVHEGGEESRGKVKIERGMPLRSLKFGLIGKADVVAPRAGAWIETE
jgi:CRISPR-associated exonuclease Cas4